MSQIDEVRAAADIVKIVGDYVKLRKSGVRMTGLCPFHQEKTPSFSVHPGKQLFYCFGCGVGGDVFKFVMQIENLSFPEALRRVAEKAGITLRETGGESYDANARERAAIIKLHELAAKFYARQLGASAEGRVARAYLADRGLTDEVVARFRLGYAPADGRALAAQLTEPEFAPEFLEKSGLVLRDAESNRRYDRFRRRVMFPIHNDTGKVVAFGGRALGDDQPKYLNSPETPIYTKSRVLYHLDRAGSAIRKLDYAVLVEGYMDCIAVATAGIENVVASCGTSLTESQIRLLGRYSKRVVVNYDPDSAGVAATERSLALLLEEGFEAKVLALPGGLDPDSFVRKRGAAEYQQWLSKAPTYIDYLTERAAARHDLSAPEGKVAAANAVMPYLARVPDALLRSELATRVAERLRLDERLLGEEVKRAAREKRREVSAGAEIAPRKFNQALLMLVKASLENQSLADDLLPELVASGDCQGLAGENVLQLMVETRTRGETIEPAQLAELADAEGRQLIHESLFWDVPAPDHPSALTYRQALKRDRMLREKNKAKARGFADRASLEAYNTQAAHVKQMMGVTRAKPPKT